MKRLISLWLVLMIAPVAALAEDTARYDVNVDNAPAPAFFQGLVAGTPVNMLVHPDVKGSVTLKLKQVTIEEALNAAREMYGYDYRPMGNGYLVLPATQQTRVFQLNYLDLQRVGVSKTRVSSGQITQSAAANGSGGQGGSSGGGSGGDDDQQSTSVTGTAVMTRNESDFWKGVESDIRRMVSGGNDSNVIINHQSGVILVRAMPNELRDVADYVRKTQSTVTRQVVLEAKIVEVTLSSGYQAGINWAAIMRDGNNRYFIGQQAPQGGFDVNPLTSGGGQTVPIGPGTQITNILANTIGSALTFAVDTPDFNALIELLSAQGRTRVLSSPRVSTLHNQKAIIKAGSDEFFVTGVKSDTTTGTSTTQSLDVELTPFFSGVALDVTPQIAEDGSVLLHIHPTVSDVTDQNKQVQFNGISSNLPLALSEIRESDSVVKAHSGQVIVIGGLMRETRKRDAHKVPMLGDIPGVGKLFRSERDLGQTVELVLLLRPLVATDGDWDGMVRDSLARTDAMARHGKVEGNRDEIKAEDRK
ncbi:MAG TPA: pilus (MSHA type) biogenesis protein MshL [Steroidobacteraceae bacterium]|jgi:MSHA biogenesis protein MshL|nr:pilus (MSHA type) biogenesis protein MshL [Steroidobacteraceae bacterium]